MSDRGCVDRSPIMPVLFLSSFNKDSLQKKITVAAFLLMVSLRMLGQHDSAHLQWLANIPKQFERTQVPAALNYKVEDVIFNSRETGLTYGGTLTIPRHVKPFKTVILLSGTGAQDRDYTAYSHKFYWILANYLSEHGIATLRLDDRGKGLTTGNFDSATTHDLALDVKAAVEYLHTRADIDRKRIGLLGHSEGGIIAPMVYNMPGTGISFLVLLAPPVVGLRAVNAYQEALYLHKEYPVDSVANARLELHDMIVSQLPQSAKSGEDLLHLIQSCTDQFCRIKSPEILNALRIQPDPNVVRSLWRTYRGFMSPWWQFILSYQPETDLLKVKCPVYAIFGTNDLQVPPNEDAALLSRLLPDPAQVKVELAPGINHFMQPAKTGEEEAYFYSNVTFDPGLMQKIANWIHAH